MRPAGELDRRGGQVCRFSGLEGLARHPAVFLAGVIRRCVVRPHEVRRRDSVLEVVLARADELRVAIDARAVALEPSPTAFIRAAFQSSATPAACRGALASLKAVVSATVAR